MSEVEKLAKLLSSLIAIFGFIACIMSAGALLGFGMDNSDKSATVRSGLKLHTDHLTGCQYFSASSGGLIPRVDRNGRHICTTDLEAP